MAPKLKLTGCAFTNNRARDFGGGAYFLGGATLTGCAFTSNRASTFGGGAFFSTTTVLTGCAFTGNGTTISSGGGASFGGTATLTGCVFTSNESPGNGGGARFAGTATLAGCTFTGNEAEYGGGSYFGNEATVTNGVYINNTATNSGGGIRFLAGGTVINSTFYNNTAVGQGGGIGVAFNDADINTAGVQAFPFNLRNSLLLGNTAANAGSGHQLHVDNADAANVVDIQSNLIAGGAAGIAYANSGTVAEANTVAEADADAVFASTMADEGNYLRLAEGSPAANAGNNDYLNNGTPDDPEDDIKTDAAGNARVQRGAVDMGAYESDFKTAQDITFTLADRGSTGAEIALEATVNSGLPVSYASSNEGVAAVVDNGAGIFVLRLVSAGTATITASQSGNDTYEAATDVERPITVRDLAIFRVTTTGDAGNDGSTWDKAMTLQAALAAATIAGDQVWIEAGTYKPHADDRTATFTVPAGVLVYGGFAGMETALADRAGGATILSGDLLGDDIARPARGASLGAYNAVRDDNSRTVVTVTGAGVTLDGLTITAGDGGTVVDLGFGIGGVGGGLYATAGTTGATLMGCTFTSNDARYGGGAFFSETATLMGCSFMGNTATSSGGGVNFNGTATLTGCTFTSNESGTSGGGGSFGGTATLASCTFTGNGAESGGGARFFGRATVTNGVYINNTASRGSGGISLRVGGTVINSTFYGNTGGQGGGIFVGFRDADPNTAGDQVLPFNLRNSLLVGNTAADVASGHQVRVNNGRSTDVVDIRHNLIAGGATGATAGIVYETPGAMGIVVDNTVGRVRCCCGVCKHRGGRRQLFAPCGGLTGH